MIILPEWLLSGLQLVAIMGFLWSLGPLVHHYVLGDEDK